MFRFHPLFESSDRSVSMLHLLGIFQAKPDHWTMVWDYGIEWTL